MVSADWWTYLSLKGRVVVVELPHVKHLGKSRFRLLHGFGLAYRVICASWWFGRNGTFRRGRRGPSKPCYSWRVGKYVGRPEREGKCLQGSPDTAAAHNRPDSTAVQVIATCEFVVVYWLYRMGW
jgi:hypothetical protein